MAGTIITKKGLQLIAKLVASGTAMTFSRVSVGTGAVPAGYDPGSMTDLNQYKMDGSISSCSFLGDEASIIMQISSLGVETGFTITETGLYATDPDEGEILYAYLDLTKDPQYVYAENSAISKFVEITLVVKVGTVERVTAQLNPRSLLTRDGDISDTSINDLELIDTKYPVPSAGESTKVFMGKVKKYIEDTKPLDADLTVYVATTGSDTTGDGTSSKPYKTITYALSTIPKIMNGYTASIVVAAGTYTEAVSVGGVDGHLELLLQGNTILNSLTVTQSNLTIGSFTFMGSPISLTLQWLGVAYASRLFADATININTTSIVIPSFNSTPHSIYCFDSQLYLSGVIVMTGNTDIGIAAYANSDVFLGTVTGTGLNLGIVADRSKIACMSNKIAAINPSLAQYAGVIVNGFGAKIGSLSSDATIYVATTGSDIAGNGSVGNPFKTIQYAINTLPKDLGGYGATVVVADGTYSESLYISGFKTGALYIRSGHPGVLSSLTKITSIGCNNNSCYIAIDGFEITDTLHDGITCNSCANILLNSVRSIGIANTFSAIFATETNLFRVYHCELSNKKYAVRVINTKGYVQSSTGTGNEISIQSASASIIHLGGLRPEGTVQQVYGGVFFYENGTQISDEITAGLSCTWGTIRSGYYRHGNMSGPAIITISVRIESIVALTAGSTYTIPGFPAPAISGVSTVSVCTDMPSRTGECWMNASGVLYFKPSVNVAAGAWNICFSTTYKTNL